MKPYYEEDQTLVFREKSREYPGGRVAILADERIVFPELRFLPRIGEKYQCRVRFYERRDSIIGVAIPKHPEELPNDEYIQEDQIVIAVTFFQGRESGQIVARHPVSGCYIVPTDASANFITPGTQCWVMVVQRGTGLVAHWIKDQENIAEEMPAVTSKTVARHDPVFAAKAELSLQEKKGMGRPPIFQYKGKSMYPWEILGIGKEAQADEIRKAYREKSREAHPDVNNGYFDESFIALAHAHDWMFFRRQWVDDITRRTAKITAQPVAVSVPVTPPTPPKRRQKVAAAAETPPPDVPTNGGMAISDLLSPAAKSKIEEAVNGNGKHIAGPAKMAEAPAPKKRTRKPAKEVAKTE